MHRVLSSFVPLSALLGTLALVTPARAVDGVVLIDQNRALAGNVTPGDRPGYPVTISQPGSYRLASNLTPPLYLSALEVTAPNVTIDLNGFSLVAQPKPNQCCSDIAVLQTGTAAKGLTIANGGIVDFTVPIQAMLNTGPDGILEPYPVVMRDLVITVPSNYLSGEIQLQSYSRVERVSGPKLFVLLHCPSTIVGSVFGTIVPLSNANDFPGARCVVSATATR